MTPPSSDRNLLVGILALQLDFISRDQLIAAMHTWITDKSQNLEDILVGQRVIDDGTRDLLLALLDKHLQLHEHNVHQSLAALSSVESALPQQLQSLGDSDLAAGLSMVTIRHESTEGARRAADITRTFDSAGLSDDGVRFRILRPHARGGLGQVSVALDKEFNREVALKEIQQRFADDEQSRIRFLLEAEVTGGLEHPGIVPVYGLGFYGDGRPFYAMRFVKGDTLEAAATRFHKEHQGVGRQAFQRSDFRKLLGRFLDICDAIQYAHCRGVLHRDLKPGNIMLGRYGETIVVDWGLSKILDATSAEATTAEPALQVSSESQSAATQMGSVVGTPAYMSPEQAGGRFDLLGPASDVYSLGTTLYFLLTARAPHADEDLASILRKTQQGEFPSPREVRPEVPRSLEMICLKAMAVEPRDRYATVEALAEDIQRWLADEATVAMPDGAGAKVGRWLRKNRAIATTGLAASMLITAVSVATAFMVESYRQETSQQYAVAQQQRARALQLAEANQALADAESSAHKVAETRRIDAELSRIDAENAKTEAIKRGEEAEAVTEFLVSALRSPDPRHEGHEVTVAQVLDAALNKLEESFPNRPLTQAYLQNTIGTTYRGLGLYSQGIQAHRKAHETYRREEGEKHPDTLKSANALAMCLAKSPHQADNEEAHQLFETTYAARREVLGLEHFDTTASILNLATSFQSRKEYEKAVELFQLGLDIRQRTLGPKHVDTLVAMNNLALAYDAFGESELALQLFKETLDLKVEILQRTHYSTVISIHNYGYQLHQMGRNEEALPLLEEAFQLRTERYGPTHPSRLITMRVLGTVHRTLEHNETAIELFRELVEARRTTLGEDHPDTIQALDDLSESYLAAGDYAQLVGITEQLLTLEQQRVAEDDPAIYLRQNNLGYALREDGQVERSIPLLRSALNGRSELLGPAAPETLVSLNNLIAALRDQKAWDEAIALAERRLEHFRSSNQVASEKGLSALDGLARIVSLSGDKQRTAELLKESLALHQAEFGDLAPATLQGMNNLGWTLFESGELQQAGSMLEATVEGRIQVLGAEHRLTRSSRHNLAMLRLKQGEFDSAISLYVDNLQALRNEFGDKDPRTLRAMNHVGHSTYLAGRYQEAKKILKETLQLREEVLGIGHLNTLITGSNLARTYLAAGMNEESLALLEDIAARCREHLGTDSQQTLATIRLLAQQYRRLERFDDALQAARETVDARRSLSDPDANQLSADLEELGHCLIQEGANDEAEEVLRECLSLRVEAESGAWLLGRTNSLIGEALLGQEKLEDAEETLLAAYEAFQEFPPELRVGLAEQIRIDAVNRLIRLFSKLKQPEDEQRWRDELQAIQDSLRD